MEENKLVEGFEQNEQEEKEEIRRYGLKQKQKSKNRINLIINLILGFILLSTIIYVLNLRNQIILKEFEINILTEGNKDLYKSLNVNKKNIDKLSAQNNGVQNKAFSLLTQCFNETNSLSKEINNLKEELLYNQKVNQEKLNQLIQKNIDLRDKIRYIDDYYNIC